MFFVELSDSLLVKYPTVPKSMVAAATTAILVPNCCLKPLKWLEYHDILPFLPHVHRSLFSNTLYILWNILDYVFSGHPLYFKRISRITCLGQYAEYLGVLNYSTPGRLLLSLTQRRVRYYSTKP